MVGAVANRLKHPSDKGAGPDTRHSATLWTSISGTTTTKRTAADMQAVWQVSQPTELKVGTQIVPLPTP